MAKRNQPESDHPAQQIFQSDDPTGSTYADHPFAEAALFHMIYRYLDASLKWKTPANDVMQVEGEAAHFQSLIDRMPSPRREIILSIAQGKTPGEIAEVQSSNDVNIINKFITLITSQLVESMLQFRRFRPRRYEPGYDHYPDAIYVYNDDVLCQFVQGMVNVPDASPPTPPPELAPPPAGSQTPVPSKEEIVKALFVNLGSEEYDSLRRDADKINHVYRSELAKCIAPALNAKIQGMEHETLDQKKALSRWVNDQLEPLGLAVQCPNTGRPAKLRGMTGGSGWPDTGRFCFETHHDGKREKSSYSETLPELMLTDATPTQEPETPWQAKVGPKTRRQDRNRS